MNVGNNVFIKSYHHGEKWLPGVIQKKIGPVSFVVKLTDGRVHRCHQDQVRRRSVEVQLDSSVDQEVSVSPTEVSLPPTSPLNLLFPLPSLMLKGQIPWTHFGYQGHCSTASPSNLIKKTYHKCTRTPVIQFEPTW